MVGQAVVKVLAEGGIHAGADGAAVAVEGQVDDGLLVHGVAQGLPDADIVEGLLGVVQVQSLDQVHGALFHIEVIAQLGHLSAGQVGEHVDGAALEAHHDAVGVLNDLVGHLVQIGGGAPVFIELFQDDGVLGGAGHKLEGPGAHGGGVLLVIIHGQNGRCHVGNKFVAGFGNGDCDGALIKNLYRLDNRKRLHQGVSLRGVGAAIDGIFHILRRHRLTVVELHTLPQGKGVRHSIIGDRVVLGNSRDQITCGSRLHQTFKHIEHDFFGSCRHRFVGVKTLVQVLGDTHRDLVGVGYRFGRASFVLSIFRGLFCAAVSATGEYSAQEADQKKECHQFLLHVVLLLCITAALGQCWTVLSALTEMVGSIQL